MSKVIKKKSFLPYFCTACAAKINEIDHAFVLEERSSKYFCSEECIVKFHSPHIDFFQKQEVEWRKEAKGNQEKITLSEKEQTQWIDSVLRQPDEIWLLEDALGMEYYSLIKRCGTSIDSPYVIVVCHLFSLKPSFVFHHVFTKNLSLVEKYRWGKSFTKDELPNRNHKNTEMAEATEEVVLSKDLLQEIELLRSQLLSELILLRSDHDIPLEGFSAYEKYMEKTIDKPDESFEYKTKDGQLLLVNISDQQEKSKTLYYFVVSMKLTPDIMEKHAQILNSKRGIADQPMIIPVLAFPSMDFEVYQHYKRGNCISKRSLN